MIENQPQIDYHIYKTYQILGLVGKGTYGQVYKVKNKKTHQIFAIKKICDAYQNITDAKRTYRQLNYLFQLNHPCIVKLYQVIPGYRKNLGIIRQSNTSRTDFIKGSYQDHHIGCNTQKTHDGVQQSHSKLSKHVYALFQYVETDLSKALRRCKLQPIQRKYIAYQILHGISYLHKSKLIHRDIKPSNILIDTNCDIKICDFGLCRIKQQKNSSQQNQQNIITEYVASRWYRPPQILLGFSPCNQAIDMWGIGCVFAELILRNPIFQGQSTMDQLQKIFRIIGLPNENQICKLESDQAKFLLRTFTFSRKNKPQKISEVLNEASDQELDLIQKLLKFNPSQRLSAQQALKHKYFNQIQQMKYNYNKYNIPVKIIDHTDQSFFFSQLKQFQTQGLNIQKNQMKKKQITLQQYQVLIQDLERITSRSSNRFYEEYKQGDRIKQYNQESERILKQKSTRQSNFLLEHKRLEQKNYYQGKDNKDKYQQKSIYDKRNQFPQSKQPNQYQSQQIKETQKILQIYNKQKSCSSSHKNLKISQIVKDQRNVHSTMDNYYGNLNPNLTSNNYKTNINYNTTQNNTYQQTKNDILFVSSNNKLHFNNKCNKSVQNNLQETYGMFFNPFQKQIKKPKQIKKTQHLTTLKDANSKKKVSRKQSTNKSNSKHSIDTQKDKSFAKNSSKTIHPQFLDQTKNKYNSYTTLNNINQLNYLSQVKGKIPLYKKPKDINKQSGKLLKDFSKTKIVSEEKSIKIQQNKNNLKSSQNLIINPGRKTTKQRKKSKDFKSLKNQDSHEYTKKTVQNSIQQKHWDSVQNCFAKIDIKQKVQKLKIQIKQPNQPKKKTLQKKLTKNKSVGKKKSQTKISSNK